MDNNNNDSPEFEILMNILITKNNKNYLLNIASNKSKDFLIIIIHQSSYVYCKKYIIDDFKEINFFKKYNNFDFNQLIEILIKILKDKKDLISIEEEENKQIKLNIDIEIVISGTNTNVSKESIQFTLINDDMDQIIKNNLIWFSALFLFQIKENDEKKLIEQENKIKNLSQEISDLKGIIEELKNRNLSHIFNKNNIIEDEFNFKNSQIVNNLNINKFEFILEKIKLIYYFKGKKIKLKMLYSATVNGDESIKFHELCDYHNNTLVLVQTETDNIFGGYVNKQWNSLELGRKMDNNSFLFSVNKQKIYNPRTDISSGQKYHLFCSDKDGPCFYAFSIEDLCLEKGGYCDEMKKCNYDSFEIDYELNEGNKYFKVKQLEIYEILSNN